MKDRSYITERVYKNVRNSYTAALASAKNGFYRNRIGEAEGNVKRLYSVTSDLLGRSRDNPLPPHTSEVNLANDFLRYFNDKISKIRDELDNMDCQMSINDTFTNSRSCDHVFTEFQPLSENDITKIVKDSKSTTCELDILPTPKLKEHLSKLSPLITEIVNRSLSSGVFPEEWKGAIIKPLLKKKGLPLELNNYRPVSNLTFLSKILEKAAMKQISRHIESNNLLPSYQSAYRKFHSVETAMMKMYSDLLDTADKRYVSIVVMIDLSAAFDTIDVPILLKILHADFLIQGIPLKWIELYLTNRTVKVVIERSASDTEPLRFGVPQGSCAGPVLFTLYIAALNKVVQKYPADLYGYADDHKVAFKFRAGETESEAVVIQQVSDCLNDIVLWMNRFKLKMNNSKTEIIVYGTRQQLSKLNITSVNVGGIIVNCVDTVRDLGVQMTSTLNFDKHITRKCQIANIQLRNLKTIRKYLTQKSTEILVHGLIHSHLDFCNGLFINIPSYQLDKLQRVQNHAARIVTGATYEQSSVEILRGLHWLPIRARIMFKAIVTVFRVVNGTAPSFLCDMFISSKNQYRQRLRSSSSHLFDVPITNTKLAGRSLAVAGPQWWNSLPNCLKEITNENQFKSKLKTYLFKQFYT